MSQHEVGGLALCPVGIQRLVDCSIEDTALALRIGEDATGDAANLQRAVEGSETKFQIEDKSLAAPLLL